MSELFDGYDGPDRDESEDDSDEVDEAAVVAFLDQEEAAWDANREQFLNFYGFDHQCRCSEDYTEGNLKNVTECFMTLTAQALQRSAEATHELRLMGALLDQLLKLNQDLVKMMEDAGLHDELEKYYNEPVELDSESAFTELEDVTIAVDVDEPEAEDADSSEDPEQ